MATNRLQRALDRLEAHRLELERQIISEIEELFFKDSDEAAITDYHAPGIGVPWQVFGDEHSATEGDTPSSMTWLDTN
jgi:hypothetical protein